jgi:hypothetical protein
VTTHRSPAGDGEADARREEAPGGAPVAGKPVSEGAVYDHAEKRSVYYEAVAEAERYKWIRSEEAERDLGRDAIEEWNARHFWGWCRMRWLEHLRGEVCYTEFGESDFGRLRPERWEDPDLLAWIVQMVSEGRENLEILTLAVHQRRLLRRVVDVLEIIDLNTVRDLRFPEAAAC